MRIQGLIRKLEALKKKMGNVRVLVDTEAAEFNAHCVDITGVHGIPNEYVGEKLVLLHLDNSTKIHRPAATP